ncbi:MAG: YdcF family protein [Acidobacteriota bacterium]
MLRIFLSGVLGLTLLTALAYTFRFQLLVGVGHFLVVRDKLENADILFLLNGDASVRPQYAAALYNRGLATKIVIARSEDSPATKAGAYPNTTDSNLRILRSLGVPESALVEVKPTAGVMHTFDEAEVLRDYVNKNSVKRVILVTSDIHSRRSRFIFTKILADRNVQLMLAPIPDRKYGADNWWKSEDGIIGCQNEYLKLVYYHIKY